MKTSAGLLVATAALLTVGFCGSAAAAPTGYMAEERIIQPGCNWPYGMITFDMPVKGIAELSQGSAIVDRQAADAGESVVLISQYVAPGKSAKVAINVTEAAVGDDGAQPVPKGNPWVIDLKNNCATFTR